jgi:type II secretory pathway component PulF
MPTFKYRAINPEGKMLDSTITASDRNELIRQLEKLGLIPVKIQERAMARGVKRKFGTKVKTQSVILFTKQLYTLLKSGIPILASLNAIKEQNPDPSFKQMVEIIAQDIEQGGKLSEALGKFSKVFPPIYINSVRVGEVSGTLDSTLVYLYQYLEQEVKVRKNVKRAFRYPVLVICALIVAFIVLITMVVPAFIPIFESFSMELPLPTRILIGLYEVIQNYWIFLILGFVGILMGLYFYKKTPGGKYQIDRFLLNLPIMGNLLMKVSISRFAKIFYTMNRTGVPVINTFELLKNNLENEVFSREMSTILSKIKRGQGIANSLSQSPLFTPFIVEMVAIGEKAGSLDEMLDSVSEYYDSEVNETIDSMTSMIEPVVTVLLGGMVLIFALAIFLPMWDLISAVGH